METDIGTQIGMEMEIETQIQIGKGMGANYNRTTHMQMKIGIRQRTFKPNKHKGDMSSHSSCLLRAGRKERFPSLAPPKRGQLSWPLFLRVGP